MYNNYNYCTFMAFITIYKSNHLIKLIVNSNADNNNNNTNNNQFSLTSFVTYNKTIENPISKPF